LCHSLFCLLVLLQNKRKHLFQFLNPYLTFS
jgi:hypothetical protein